MTAQILDGKRVAGEIRATIASEVKALPRQPGLATVLVGEDAGSEIYVRNKHLACEEVGFFSSDWRLPAESSQADVLDTVSELNADPNIDAFLVQLPLPDGVDERVILEAIDPAKDADGLHPENLGQLVLGHPRLLPCTPNGIITLGERFGVSWAGANVVIVGRGVTVGRPLAIMLSAKGRDSTVTVCHSRTPEIGRYTSNADIIVAATGRAGLIKPDMVKPGAIVFDVGISRGEKGLVGDVAPEVREVAGWLAPMPGGVGPMTIAMLLGNTLIAAQRR